MEQTPTFAQIGRVEAIRRLFEGSGFTPFTEPLWSKAADGDCPTTASAVLLEGIDFNLEYFPLKHLGYKAVVQATGELLAVLAKPRTLEIRIGVSSKLDFEQVAELWSGVLAAAGEFGYTSLALDLQPSRIGLAVTAAAGGIASSAMCASRPAAASKDLICVSGSLGAAYLGQQLLEREKSHLSEGEESHKTLEKYKMLVAACLKPEIPANVIGAFEESGICPSTGYFVNRGLSDAVLRLCRDNGLGAKIYADKIPFEGNSFALGKELDVDPVSAAMNGGDDCRLMFTVPILQLEKFRRDFQAFDILGHLAQPSVGSVLVTPDGVELSIRAQGWTFDES